MRLWKVEDLAGAERAYRQLIEASSGDPRQAAGYMAILAEIQHEKGDNAAAIQTLNEALRLDPNLLIPKLMLAKEQEASGDLRGEELTLREYLALDPGNAAAVKILADLQEREKSTSNSGAGGGVAGIVNFSRAIADLSLDQRAPELTDIHVTPPKITGHAPEWPHYEGKDQAVIDMQTKRDNFLATQQQKEAEAEKKHQEFEATSDEVKRSELAADAAKLKAESAQAGLEATKLNKEIKKHMLIHTSIEAAPPASGDQQTPPPAAPKTGQ